MKRRITAIAAVALLGLAAACDDRGQQVSMAIPESDPERGERAIAKYGCGACHTIPGIAGANATVGPPLDGFARSVYVAGVVPNLPDDLVLWIVDPPAIDPRTAMPDLGVTESDARDIAAYLYTAGR